MATVPQPNAAVVAARGRRETSAIRADIRTAWFIDNVVGVVSLTMESRVKLATELVRDRVVRNITRPVTVGTGPRGGRVVTDRSKPGEFPKAETTQLSKTIFGDVRETSPGVFDGFIGTPLDYGVILELRMDRSFLVRTLNESQNEITKILTGPIR